MYMKLIMVFEKGNLHDERMIRFNMRNMVLAASRFLRSGTARPDSVSKINAVPHFALYQAVLGSKRVLGPNKNSLNNALMVVIRI